MSELFFCLSDIYLYYIYVVSCIVLCMLYWVPLENEMKHLKGLSRNTFKY